MSTEEGQRSLRLSASDTCRAQRPMRQCVDGPLVFLSQDIGTSRQQNIGHGPAFRTRSTKMRKLSLRPVEGVAAGSASEQGGKKHNYEEHTTNPGQQTSRLRWIPEKRILDLILDILQRRDTHEIFAEPVDPIEVEDYYEIIEEPMDFGTMRAKLHEGLYTSLEKFEHDIFLISQNAMKFNPSATIYFRQARAIDDLAKKVLHALKSDPEHFESNFLDGRQRTASRSHAEAMCSRYNSSSKLATDVKTRRVKTKRSSELSPCSFPCSSNVTSSIATCLDTRDNDLRSGISCSTRGRSTGDRRFTYKSWTSFISNQELTVSTIYGNSKPLKHVNQQDFGYKESLMLFVKDLTPKVQMIANRKLLGRFTDSSERQTSSYIHESQAPICKNSQASISTQCGYLTLDLIFNNKLLDQFHHHPSVSKGTKIDAEHFNFQEDVGPNPDRKMKNDSLRGDVDYGNFSSKDVNQRQGCYERLDLYTEEGWTKQKQQSNGNELINEGRVYGMDNSMESVSSVKFGLW